MSVWSSMVVSSDHPSCRCLHVVSLVSCSFAIVVSTCPNHTCLIMFAKVLLSCMLHATFPSFSIHFPSISYDFFMFSFLKRSVCESQEFDVAPMLPNGVPTESQQSPNGVPTESQQSPNGVPTEAVVAFFKAMEGRCCSGRCTDGFLTGFDVEKHAESLRKA